MKNTLTSLIIICILSGCASSSNETIMRNIGFGTIIFAVSVPIIYELTADNDEDDPYDYGGVYHYRMTELQREALLNDMSVACEHEELTTPGTHKHQMCIANKIKERDTKLHEESIARAGASKTTIKTEQKIIQKTE